MPEVRWDELPIDEQVAALRRELDAYEARERQNIQERAYRFGQIERRLDALAEELKLIRARLDQLV